MSSEGAPSRDVAYVEELVDRALGRSPSPGFGPHGDDDGDPRALPRTRQLVRGRVKLLVFRVVHRFVAPVAREELRVQLEPFRQSHNAVRAGIASLEVAVEDLRDAVERLEADRARSPGDGDG